jgi:hypothetical protein
MWWVGWEFWAAQEWCTMPPVFMGGPDCTKELFFSRNESFLGSAQQE